MRRNLKVYFSKSALKSLFYIPPIISNIKNWVPFLFCYAGLKQAGTKYYFRNNITIQTSSGVDASTVLVVFIRKDYGDVPENSTIIDIGANIGAYSIFAANTSLKTKIYAFEPVPDNYKLLKENIAVNHLHERIIPYNLGVAGKKGKQKLFLAGDSPYHSIYGNPENQASIDMDCCSLEDIFIENKIKQCNLLKIDCEGAEYDIFYNTSEECLGKIDKIRMEYHNRDIKDYNIESLTKFLSKHHFTRTYQNKNSLMAWFEKAE